MSNDADLIQGLATNWETSDSSKADNPTMLTTLGGLVGQMTRWKKEEDENELGRSLKKTMVSSAEEEEEESCLVSGWRCMSSVLEQGVTCFQRPRGFQR